MRALTCILALGCLLGSGEGLLADQELVEQNQIFQRWWGRELETKFNNLPTKGYVPDERMPYSGYYYPDSRGGTIHVMQKYDLAFNNRRMVATAFERWDTTAYTQPVPTQQRVGLFGRRTVTTVVNQTPHWHGHCNGWAAATIRHAEPRRSVVRNGVTFTPADIKALLAELYMYSQYEELKGSRALVDAAGLHITLANWLGLQSHPLAMEAMPGKEKWNYPIYGYESTTTQRNSRQVDVRTKLYYLYYSNGEYQQSPRIKRVKYFHYALNLNEGGEITGGYFYNDSSRIDLLWVPLYPAKGGTRANPRGNPHIDVETVLAIWRASVADGDLVAKWVNIDPNGESLRPAPAPQVAATGDVQAAPATSTESTPNSEVQPAAATAPADETPTTAASVDTPAEAPPATSADESPAATTEQPAATTEQPAASPPDADASAEESAEAAEPTDN